MTWHSRSTCETAQRGGQERDTQKTYRERNRQRSALFVVVSPSVASISGRLRCAGRQDRLTGGDHVNNIASPQPRRVRFYPVGRVRDSGSGYSWRDSGNAKLPHPSGGVVRWW